VIDIKTGDLDGDGAADFLVAYASPEQPGQIRALLSDGAGGAAAGGSVALDSPPTCLALALIDDDDDLDVAVGMSGTGAYVIVGDGAGGFEDPTGVTLLGESSDIAIGDLNGAGHRDLALVRPEADAISSVLVTPSGPPARFVRGDANVDGEMDISDAISILGYLFLGTPVDLPCQKSADVDDESSVNLTDAVYILNFLFLDAVRPGSPYPDCGLDLTADGLTCESHAPCE